MSLSEKEVQSIVTNAIPQVRNYTTKYVGFSLNQTGIFGQFYRKENLEELELEMALEDDQAAMIPMFIVNRETKEIQYFDQNVRASELPKTL